MAILATATVKHDSIAPGVPEHDTAQTLATRLIRRIAADPTGGTIVTLNDPDTDAIITRHLVEDVDVVRAMVEA